MTDRPSVIEAEVALGDQLVRYQVRRSARAQRMRLRMLPGIGLEVVLPPGSTPEDALRMIQREHAWVLREVRRVPPPVTLPLVDGMRLAMLGEHLTLRLTGASGRIRRVGGELLVPPPGSWLEVEQWYRSEARRVLTARAAYHADVLAVRFGRVAIKDTRSRWGSCSSKGNLNFSWRLLLAPYAVMDYVVAHEVAHLRELNHSPRFWATVAALCPTYRERRAWLRTNGWTLTAWPAVPVASS